MVKVSPDEDSQSQVEGVADAVWASDVGGVIVGNTTTRRDDFDEPQEPMSLTEKQTIQEKGGYSGPQLFPRTVDLVRRYRQALDQRGRAHDTADAGSKRTASAPPENPTTAADATQPLIQLPERHKPTAEDSGTIEKIVSTSSSTPQTGGRPSPPPAKVIFATGGITTGSQALEVLNAGASLAFVYTGMVYGGSGTITRMKQEMREELHHKSQKRP